MTSKYNTFVKANDIEMYYEIYGNNENPTDTLVLIGGLSRDHRIWSRLVPQLNASLRIVLFDNRGTGQTSKPDIPYTVELLANDIIAGLKALRLDNITLLGHSMGSFIAAYIAAKQPGILKSLILMSCANKQVEKATEYLNRRIALVKNKLSMANNPDSVTIADRDDILAAMPSLYSEYFLTAENIKGILEWETSNPHPQPAFAFIRHAEACIRYDATKVIPTITVPTTIIYGTNDRMYTKDVSEEIAKSITKTEVRVISISDAAHMIQIEQPKLLAKQIHALINLKNTSARKRNNFS